MNSTFKSVLVSLLGGAAGALLCVQLHPPRAKPAPMGDAYPDDGVRPASADDSPYRLAELEARVRSLESRADLLRAPAREPVPREALETVPPDVLARIRALEADIAEVRRAGTTPAFSPDPSTDPVGVQHFMLAEIDRTQLAARIPLQQQFLELWPDHEDAKVILTQLVADYCESGQPHRAMRAIDRYVPIMNLSWQDAQTLRLRASRRGL